ncbi:hypothetical protein V493_05420 [Pseudogymnoascus sp. VKM F-4281 (FW-2241)]|nr:hypothetical protein V493_05420 [Pseudogymnoascus sp. VKM F-4281 (FW-2241)]
MYSATLSRRIGTVARMSNASSSPFTQAVVSAVRNLYPEKLADSSFDNTGLLLEAPYRKNHLKNSVLLTVDLTKGVADEAIRRKDSVVIAYHPIIFRSLKAITLANTQQQSLLRLAQEGISVYCPHTAVDAAPGGLNDWLADVVTGKANGEGQSDATAHTKEVITPVKEAVPGFENAGYGRIVRFKQPQRLGTLVDRITNGLGPLSGISLAVPQATPTGTKADLKISSVGICAGSGSMLNGQDVDLLFTGELSHHEALGAIEQGKVVVTAFHSNSERKFLSQGMKRDLQVHIAEALQVQAAGTRLDGAKPVVGEVPSEVADFEVAVSEVDRDPYEIIVAGSSGW